jgi:acyl-coenzyme A synthetase/AMP-(fatty) acid ligase
MIVSSVSDDKLGESVALVIEIEDIVEAEKIKLLSQIRELANPYELPKHIICVKGIPRTQNGKVDRKAVKRIISNQ